MLDSVRSAMRPKATTPGLRGVLQPPPRPLPPQHVPALRHVPRGGGVRGPTHVVVDDRPPSRYGSTQTSISPTTCPVTLQRGPLTPRSRTARGQVRPDLRRSMRGVGALSRRDLAGAARMNVSSAMSTRRPDASGPCFDILTPRHERGLPQHRPTALGMVCAHEALSRQRRPVVQDIAVAPPLVPPTTEGSLADLPARNAASNPPRVGVLPQGGQPVGRRHQRPSSSHEVRALAKGLIAAGDRGRRPRRHHEQDPLRVDPDRLRDLDRRRGHGADLRDLVAPSRSAGSSATRAAVAVMLETPDARGDAGRGPRPGCPRCATSGRSTPAASTSWPPPAPTSPTPTSTRAGPRSAAATSRRSSTPRARPAAPRAAS